MKKFLLTILTLLGFGATTYAQTEQTELSTSELTTLYKTQSRNWGSIHDPSVVWDSSTQTFYIYGSHYAELLLKRRKALSKVSFSFTITFDMQHLTSLQSL